MNIVLEPYIIIPIPNPLAQCRFDLKNGALKIHSVAAVSRLMNEYVRDYLSDQRSYHWSLDLLTFDRDC